MRKKAEKETNEGRRMKRKEDKKEGKIVETEAVSGAVTQKDEINRDEKKE